MVLLVVTLEKERAYMARGSITNIQLADGAISADYRASFLLRLKVRRGQAQTQPESSGELEAESFGAVGARRTVDLREHALMRCNEECDGVKRR